MNKIDKLAFSLCKKGAKPRNALEKMISRALIVMDDEEGHWFTTENKRHIHVNEEGKIDKVPGALVGKNVKEYSERKSREGYGNVRLSQKELKKILSPEYKQAQSKAKSFDQKTVLAKHGIMTSKYQEEVKNGHPYDALHAYTGSSYEDMNNRMRNISFDDKMDSKINDLTDAIEKTQLTEPIYVWRGIGGGFNSAKKALNLDLPDGVNFDEWAKDPENIGHLNGYIIDDGAFQSTSINKDIADGFSEKILMHIYCPAGTKGAFVGKLSVFPNEEEYVMQRGTRLVITDAKVENGRLNLEVAVIEQPKPEALTSEKAPEDFDIPDEEIEEEIEKEFEEESEEKNNKNLAKKADDFANDLFSYVDNSNGQEYYNNQMKKSTAANWYALQKAFKEIPYGSPVFDEFKKFDLWDMSDEEIKDIMSKHEEFGKSYKNSLEQYHKIGEYTKQNINGCIKHSKEMTDKELFKKWHDGMEENLRFQFDLLYPHASNFTTLSGNFLGNAIEFFESKGDKK